MHKAQRGVHYSKYFIDNTGYLLVPGALAGMRATNILSRWDSLVLRSFFYAFGSINLSEIPARN